MLGLLWHREELNWLGRDAAAGDEVEFQEGDLFFRGKFLAPNAPNQDLRERNAAKILPEHSYPGVQPEALCS